MSNNSHKKPGFPWWILILSFVISSLSAFLYFLINQRRRVLNIEPRIQLEKVVKTDVAPTHPTESHDEALKPADDLKIIDGIGPKVEAALNAAGIHTFQKLSTTSYHHLKEVLLSAGLRLPDPTSWPSQAALAAQKDMKGLKALQNELLATRRGRRNP